MPEADLLRIAEPTHPVAPAAKSAMRLKKRSLQENKRNAEIDHEPRDVYERSHERCRCARWIEANSLQNEGEHRARERPKGNNADKGGPNRARNQPRGGLGTTTCQRGFLGCGIVAHRTFIRSGP